MSQQSFNSNLVGVTGLGDRSVTFELAPRLRDVDCIIVFIFPSYYHLPCSSHPIEVSIFRHLNNFKFKLQGQDKQVYCSSYPPYSTYVQKCA